MKFGVSHSCALLYLEGLQHHLAQQPELKQKYFEFRQKYEKLDQFKENIIVMFGLIDFTACKSTGYIH